MILEDRTTLALRGLTLSAEEASTLETRVAKNDSDLSSRIQLLGYYSQRRYSSLQAEVSIVGHIVWFVTNAPQHPIAGDPWTIIHSAPEGETENYAKVKAIWLSQLESHPDDRAILENAASYFFHDDKLVAEQCLVKAKQLDPLNFDLSQKLAQLYELWDVEHAEKSVAETKISLNLAPNASAQIITQTALPGRAFAAGQFELAAASANKLLSEVEKFTGESIYGSAIQAAHTTLGRLALIAGNVETAKIHLIKSTEDAKSWRASLSPPQFDLAEDLFAAGEVDAVLQYLDQCREYCGPTHRKLIEMRARIVAKIPHTCDHANLEKEEHIAFEKICRRLELEQLDLEPAERKRSSIQRSIFVSNGDVEFWSSQQLVADHGNSDSDQIYLEQKLSMHQEHLKNLEAMLAKLDSDEPI